MGADRQIGAGGLLALDPEDRSDTAIVADAAEMAENTGEAAPDITDPHDASFSRGDVNNDQAFDLSDPIGLLGFLYLGGPAPYCQDAADADDNGRLEMADSIAMLQSLFLGQGTLAAPYGERGFDSTPDELFCGN
ncbi:MAG: hypothetical protein HY717_05815 [Planctomycetes bacterium]|nr:hypothetical protein [Planctomycetota bacterium]